MTMRRLGRTDLSIEPLIFGCNVLGWTLQEADAFRVLDAFLDAGFTALDTADVYGKGKSETIIGNWMTARGNRAKVQVYTKVGSDMPDGTGLSAKWIVAEVEASLKRLQTDRIDLYQSHKPDPKVPQEETLKAFDGLVKAGKVRWLGSSNQDEAQLGQALGIAKSDGIARYETVQNEYNVYDRERFEGGVQGLCVAEQVSGIGYFSLARGFLAGKYRSAADADKSPRGKGVVDKYINSKGERILVGLDAISKRTGVPQAGVALAWINAQPGVGAPIASATTVEQLSSLMAGARLTLSAEDATALTEAGR